MNDKVYIVQGETGEYDDAQNWYVAVYLDKKAADHACRELNDWCVRNRVGDDCHERDSLSYAERQKLQCPFDPNWRASAYGMSYAVVEVPLRG